MNDLAYGAGFAVGAVIFGLALIAAVAALIDSARRPRP